MAKCDKTDISWTHLETFPLSYDSMVRIYLCKLFCFLYPSSLLVVSLWLYVCVHYVYVYSPPPHPTPPPQLIVAGCCSSLPPVISGHADTWDRWCGPLRGGNRLATGPDYFLHSPELNSVYAINRGTQGDPDSTVPLTPYTKGLFTNTHTPSHARTSSGSHGHTEVHNMLKPQQTICRATSSITSSPGESFKAG